MNCKKHLSSEDDLKYLSRNTMKLTQALFFVLMALPNLGQLLFALPELSKKLVRQYERWSFKVTRAKCSLVFNQTCCNEGLLPTYHVAGGERLAIACICLFQPFPTHTHSHTYY